MTATPGQAVTASSIDIDVVVVPLEVFMRARAWFMTMAYICIRTPAFMDFQTAIFVSDKILGFVQQTVDRHLLPVDHFTTAWAATVQYFSEQVRVSEVPLKALILNTAGWEHRWLGSRSMPAKNADLPRDVETNIDTIRAQARHWQSMVDKARYASQDKGKSDRGKGKGKQDKGRGKGKDMRGGNSHRQDDRRRERSRDRR